MHEISLSSPDWLDLASDDGGQVSGQHVHQHPHMHADGSLCGGLHSHGHGAGHQHNALGPQGFGSGGDAGELASQGAAVELSFPDLSGLGATQQEIGQLLDAITEADDELAAWVTGLTDDELAELEAEGEAELATESSYPDSMAPGTPFASWMNGLDDQRFAHEMALARTRGGGYLGWLADAHQIDTALAATSQRQAIRLSQDQADRDWRHGPRSRRPTDEVILANAAQRYQEGTYMPNQLLDMAEPWSGSDPFADGQFGTSTATAEDIRARLNYEINGGIAPGRSRRQPLPPVGRLATRLGLVS